MGMIIDVLTIEHMYHGELKDQVIIKYVYVYIHTVYI